MIALADGVARFLQCDILMAPKDIWRTDRCVEIFAAKQECPYGPNATAPHLDSTHFGHGAMSDLSPLSAPERTFTNASRLIGSRLTKPHCPHCSCGAQGRPVAPWLRQNNPSGKFSLSPSGKSLLGLTSSCPRGRGVGHRHERWDGMRWTRQRRARDGDGRAGFGP